MKFLSYFSFSKVSLLLVFVCLFFTLGASARQCSTEELMLGQTNDCNPAAAEGCSAEDQMAGNCIKIEPEDPQDECSRQGGHLVDLGGRGSICQPAMLLGECQDAQRKYKNHWECASCHHLSSFDTLSECKRQSEENRQQAVESEVSASGCPENEVRIMGTCVDVNSQREADARTFTQNACRDAKKHYPRYWPNDQFCNCSRTISSEAIERCISRAKEERDRSEFRRSIASQDGGYLQMCKGDNLPTSCCRTKRDAFGWFWASDDRCHCDSVAGRYTEAQGFSLEGGVDARGMEKLRNLEKEVVRCITRSKNNCVSLCQQYIERSKRGCRNSISTSYCNTACDPDRMNSVSKTDKGNQLAFYKFMEDDFLSDPRKSCLGYLEEKFILSYKSKCLDMIGKIQSEKRQTILCGKGTKEDPQCEEYCEDKAKNVYNSWGSPEGADIATQVFSKLGGGF